MMSRRPGQWARKGFTLVEVLVTLVLIGLLVGVVLPSVIGQLDRGEPARLAEDMESVRSAAKMFRVDVKRWPGRVEQLVVPPDLWSAADSVDVNNAEFPAALAARWSGPYLDVGTVGTNDSLEIALNAKIGEAFDTTHWGGNVFISMTVNGITSDQAIAISELIDGNSTVTTTDAGGRVRYDGSILTYLLSPISS